MPDHLPESLERFTWVPEGMDRMPDGPWVRAFDVADLLAEQEGREQGEGRRLRELRRKNEEAGGDETVALAAGVVEVALREDSEIREGGTDGGRASTLKKLRQEPIAMILRSEADGGLNIGGATVVGESHLDEALNDLPPGRYVVLVGDGGTITVGGSGND